MHSENEGLRLSPNIVTFYEGVNDAVEDRSATLTPPSAAPSAVESTEAAPSTRPFSSIPRLVFRFLRTHSIAIVFLDSVLRGSKAETFDTQQIRGHFTGKTEHWLNSLEALSKSHDFRFMVANHQARAGVVPVDEIRGVTYSEELEIVQKRFDDGNRLNVWERAFLVHAQLMSATRTFSADFDVPFVDVVAATDARRDILLSWVHLTPEGNQLVARAFADSIKEIVCERH